MDTAAIEKQGAAPLAADLAAIAKLATPEEVAAYTRAQQVTGDSNLFGLGVLPDLKDSSRYMVYAVQGGLGLPDRDYYTKHRRGVGEAAREVRRPRRRHAASCSATSRRRRSRRRATSSPSRRGSPTPR